MTNAQTIEGHAASRERENVRASKSFADWLPIPVADDTPELVDGFEFEPGAAGHCDTPGCHGRAVARFDGLYTCARCIVTRLMVAAREELDTRENPELVSFEALAPAHPDRRDFGYTHAAIVRYSFYREPRTLEDWIAEYEEVATGSEPREVLEACAREAWSFEHRFANDHNGTMARADYFLDASGVWSLGAN